MNEEPLTTQTLLMQSFIGPLASATHWRNPHCPMRDFPFLPAIHPILSILAARQTGQIEQTLFAGRRFIRYNTNIVPPSPEV
jgi:hypothetical protein